MQCISYGLHNIFRMVVWAINHENLTLAIFDNVIGIDLVRLQCEFILDILTLHELVLAGLFNRINNVNHCLIRILKFSNQFHDVPLLYKGEYFDNLPFVWVHNSLSVLSSESSSELRAERGSGIL